MSSSEEYWKRRAVRRMYEAMEESEKTSEIVSKFYLRASLYIEDQLDEIFEKFRKRYGLSAEEAARLISRMKNLEDLEELKQLLRNSPDDTAKTELLAELESAAYGARMRRLASLQVQIGTIMQTVYRQELEAADAFYASLAEDCYYKTVFDLQQQVGVGFSFAHADEKQIDTVLRMNWSGKHYSERIWNNTQQVAEKTQEEILLSLLTGKTEKEAAESISLTFARGAAQSRRLIRTESNFVATEMNFQAYEAAEIEKYRYLATLDLKTSKVCRKLDGKTFPVRERQTGVNAPPMHPWCRSTTVAVIDGDTLEGLTRSARDPKTGKTIKVPRSMTYDEWYEKYVKDTPEAELKEKMLKNKASDQKQFRRYQAALEEESPKTLASFQKIKYNDPEKWNELQAGYQDASRYQKLIDKAGSLNIKGKPVKRINRIDLTEYDFKDSHINSERVHQVTKELAQQYVNESVAAYRRWNGDVTVYISPSGAAVVNHKNKTVSTAYRSEEYDEKMNKLLEVLRIDKVPTDK